ncbi:MAG TPA: TolC family protein [Cyclobacteriaceae bacterium]
MRIVIILLILSIAAHAQSDKLSIEQATEIALKNNPGIKSASFEVEKQTQLKKTGFDLPKTDVSLLYGQYNSYAKKDNNITITQTIPFTAFGSQGTLNRSLVASTELKKAVTENELVYQVKQVYYQLAYIQARHQLLLQQDSLYEGFLKSAALRFTTGETHLLEKATAETQRNEIKNQLNQNEADILILRTQLKTLLSSATLPEIQMENPSEIKANEIPDSSSASTNPSLAYLRQQVDVAQNQKKVETARLAPDLRVGFFTQTLIDVPDLENGGRLATASDRFTGFQVGLAFPLWFVSHQGRIKAADLSKQAAQSNYDYQQAVMQGQWQQAMQQLTKSRNSLVYYTASALPNATLILKQSQKAFKEGEIGYAEYLLGVRSAISIKEGYLQTLNEYNQNKIHIEYLSGNK